jgi:hypothetical protein
MVPEIQIGSGSQPASSRSRIALIAALQLSVSVMVSIRNMSTPPSCSARTCSE